MFAERICFYEFSFFIDAQCKQARCKANLCLSKSGPLIVLTCIHIYVAIQFTGQDLTVKHSETSNTENIMQVPLSCLTEVLTLLVC